MIDANDRPISAFESGAQSPPSAFYLMAPSVMGVVREIRRFSKSAAEATGRIVQAKVAQDGTVLSMVIVSHLTAVLGKPAIAVAATILPDQRAAEFDGKAAILVAVQELDDAFIERIARNFGFSGLKWGEDHSNGRETYRLRSEF